MEKALTNKKYLLEKFPGKGGWTYAAIPGIRGDGTRAFGMIRVKGSIDDYGISGYHLMPMKNGDLFLPVKADIRKKIGKQAGAWVHIILYADNDPLTIPEDLLDCLHDNPLAHKVFLSYTEGEQKAFINWITDAKTTATKVDRITRTLSLLEKGLKHHERNID
ncbi:YdeI/OmpD-associated family protein [Sediminibacterium ginsengisoli]|uniref:Bacteriocin-protection, YdeI or OmpD-Associated n=1 Tax=Sediminibacterium ginsengisoli TaxID=413434 RepID=A0A1T4M8F9_9BACT|nr:YdeI/OmpD-associated family protein [Sediminibacterium ginsengisoli]SJZ63320.1 Bacteriocin-protection, YdeI or OmpD-Associated [Sediminibacterium ginsengisoli]